jgi:hypothetical protein
MSDSNCECGCPSGNYNCACCCASVTGLRAGIHPDYINSITVDLGIEGNVARTFEIKPITGQPIHIVAVSAALACIQRDEDATSAADLSKQIDLVGSEAKATRYGNTPVMFSLFTIPSWTDAALNKGGFNPHEDTSDGRTYICTGAVNSMSPSWQNSPDLFGYFCDGGVSLEVNAPDPEFGLRVTINFIDRAAFSPAYGDPVATLQHYWSCAHGPDSEFLDGFYGGNTFNIGSSESASFASSSVDESETNPFTNDTTLTELSSNI